MKAQYSLAAAFAALALSPAAASATPADLVDAIGVRGSSLDNVMGERGYQFIKAEGAQYWWSNTTITCAAVSISQGRVSKVADATPAQCNQKAQTTAHSDQAAAVHACTEAFGGDGKLGTVSALQPGFWEVIISNKYGRKVSCTGRADGTVEEWTELGKE